MRNMESIGIDLAPWVEHGLLRFHAVRPTAYSLEMHLSTMLKLMEEFAPSVLIVDPISNLFPIGDEIQVRSMLMRRIDHAKSLGITALFTNLSEDVQAGEFGLEKTQAHVSSLMDTWLIVQNVEGEGEKNRAFWIAKSRGMVTSNQLREFVLTDHGIELLDVTRGGRVLFGSARIAQERRDLAERVLSDEEIAQREREFETKRRLMESEVAAIRARYAREEQELAAYVEQQRAKREAAELTAEVLAEQRRAD
jgi:circadian clock protein KaiC